jgi:hypothetical protein
MPLTRNRDVALSEGLLALANYWHRCADMAEDEPWRVDMMRATAREFETAAAKITPQNPQFFPRA